MQNREKMLNLVMLEINEKVQIFSDDLKASSILVEVLPLTSG